MHSFLSDVSLYLPSWLNAEEIPARLEGDDSVGQMRLVLQLTRRNILEKTGGPFGAAVFSRKSGKLLSVAVNRVEPLHNSTAHAEMLALMLAQKKIGQPRLDAAGEKCVLVTSAQPCSMCFGALPWAGLHGLIIGASREDVEKLAGFDEGPLPEDWPEKLRERGIALEQNVLRDEAREVLRLYAESGGKLY